MVCIYAEDSEILANPPDGLHPYYLTYQLKFNSTNIIVHYYRLMYHRSLLV